MAAKILRKIQKVFGSTAPAGQVKQFGSLAAGAPANGTDVDQIQSLTNFLQGWYGAVLAGNAPTIEDTNALDYVLSYNVAYLQQAGVPEWYATTEYFIGSFASDGTGGLYYSITDNNLGNALTDVTKWVKANRYFTREEFNSDTNWTCPAGVTSVRVVSSAYLYNQISREGASNGLVISLTGQLYAWGGNNAGQVGDGTVTPRSSPTAVLGGLTWRQVDAQASSALGITSQGLAYGWGTNASGQLGDGTVLAKSSPVAVLGGLRWLQLASSNATTYGISAAGDAYGWGSNSGGGIGNNVSPVTVAAYSSPIAVVGGIKFRYIAAGNASAAAISVDGDLYLWGVNVAGQLGQNDNIPRSSPIILPGGLKWKHVSMSGTTVVAITTAGVAYAWGANAQGQLGDGTIVGKSTPTAVLGGIKWREVSANTNGFFGVDINGVGYAWGSNSNGNAGTNVSPLVTDAYSSPVAIAGTVKWAKLAGPTGISTAGITYGWGQNAGGQVGDGTVVPKSSPVIMQNVTSFLCPAVNEVLTNSVTIPVIPGQVYPINTFAVAMFNNQAIYQDPYGSGAIPCRIALEYFK